MDETNEIVLHLHLIIEIALKFIHKIEITKNLQKEIHFQMLVGLKKYGGNTGVKRPSFVVGLVLGKLSFVHTPVLSCPYTRTTLGLRLRFARNNLTKINIFIRMLNPIHVCVTFCNIKHYY